MKPTNESLSLPPQDVKAWKDSIRAEIKKSIKIFEGKEYVHIDTALNYMSQCFTEGFKVARRDRTSLAEHIISELKKEFHQAFNTRSNAEKEK